VCGRGGYSPHGSQEAESKTERSPDKALKGMTPVTDFLQLGPTSGSFYHCPIMLSNYESISGLIKGFGQNSHDPVFSKRLDPPSGDQVIHNKLFWVTF
jgi:hypothetical protein